MLAVEQVSLNDAGLLEQLGTKEKFWVRGRRDLFKIGRPGTGENWAEVVSADIARKLGLPHAEYSLAVCNAARGVLSPNFVPEYSRLVLGNELLATISTDIVLGRVSIRSEHTIRRVHAILRQSLILEPIGWVRHAEVRGAAGVFAGYVMFDALIGNQDRHEENWGLIVSPPKYGSVDINLAPTFDHAASLGRNESDLFRQQRMSSDHAAHGMDAYTRRARSQFVKGGVRIKTMQAFLELQKLEPGSARFWLDRLRRLGTDDFEESLESVPADWITTVAKRFAVEMLVCNRNRILELCR